MARCWEIVERRGDGKWYTNQRTTVPDEGIQYRNWVLAHDPTRYVCRETDTSAPFLASSLSPLTQLNERKEGIMTMMDEIKARRVGQDIASSLIALFELRATRDGGAQYALGRSLAAMTGEFDNADMRDAFIEGIMAGFRQVPSQLAPARHDVDGDER